MVTAGGIITPDVYTTHCRWDGPIDHTLVVDCSDPRLPEARTEAFVNYWKISRSDQMIIPGGPAVFTFSNPTCFVDQERARLLHGAHKFKRIIGIAHYGCLFYKKLYPSGSDDERYKHQLTDLQDFRSQMKRLAEGATVELYYVGPNKDGFTEYKRVD